LQALGHDIRVAFVRHPWLHPRLQAALEGPLAARVERFARHFTPDLMLVVGGFHAPLAILERLSALASRAPLVGWVGDAFDAEAARAASLYDLVAYTDTGLVARHQALGFLPTAVFAPHAVDPGAVTRPGGRNERMVFIAHPTPGRRAIVSRIETPVSLYGGGWDRWEGVHTVHAGRARHGALAGLYATHLAALNIRNELHVLNGLNQRSFDPYLSATPVVSDNQPDLARCFTPDKEVFVWRDVTELNALYDRLRRWPAEAARLGEAGQRRLLAEHTFERRLQTLLGAL